MELGSRGGNRRQLGGRGINTQKIHTETEMVELLLDCTHFRLVVGGVIN